MHITQSVVIQRQKVTLQKHAAGTKCYLVLTTEIHVCNYFYSSVMYNNKQDFVPPTGHLWNSIPDQYGKFSIFLSNKAYGQLGYHSTN